MVCVGFVLGGICACVLVGKGEFFFPLNIIFSILCLPDHSLVLFLCTILVLFVCMYMSICEFHYFFVIFLILYLPFAWGSSFVSCCCVFILTPFNDITNDL